MKKLILSMVIFVLMSSLVFGQGPQGVHEPGTGIENPEIKEAGQGVQTTTSNEGEATQIQVQNQIQAGNYTAGGKQLQVQERANNRLQLQSGGVSAQTGLVMQQEQNRLMVQWSNGKNSEVKVMPDTASERALERLRLKVCSSENNCTIELKEVGSGEQVRAAYEVQAQKQARVLGLFRTRMQVQAQVDAENGEVVSTKKPWWAFLASESEE